MITDEMVEAVARAMCDTWGYVWDGDPDDEQTAPETCVDVTPGKRLYREAARAALTAVMPRIRAAALEEAAKVADEEANAWREARDVAAAIRAMKGTSHE
jgi:hypothetical protein